jgi:streptogramin lyase
MRLPAFVAALAAVASLAACSLISLDDYTRGSSHASSDSSSASTGATVSSSSAGGGAPTSCGTFGPKKTIFPGPAAPTAIAVDHAAVYWVEQTTGFVERVDKTTLHKTTLLDSHQSSVSVTPLDIGLLPNEVVFVAAGSSCAWMLWHVPRTMPSMGDPRLLYNGCQGGFQATGFAVIANDIFVATPGTFDTPGRIMTVTNLMQGADILNSMTVRPVNVAADAQFVYFTQQGLTDVSRIAKDGTAMEVIAMNQGNVLHIEVDEKSVYWTSDAGRILRLDKQGPKAPKALAEGEPIPTDLASDAACLYWTAANAHGGVVHAVLKSGGEVVDLADIASGLPQSVAADDEGVYYADGATGEIVVIPKM